MSSTCLGIAFLSNGRLMNKFDLRDAQHGAEFEPGEAGLSSTAYVSPGSDTPSQEGKSVQGLVIGYFPALLSVGEKFVEAHVRFRDDSGAFHRVFDALVYTGDELSIGGRKATKEPGTEVWIVRFGTKNLEPNWLVHDGAPSVAAREALTFDMSGPR